MMVEKVGRLNVTKYHIGIPNVLSVFVLTYYAVASHRVVDTNHVVQAYVN